MERREPVSPKDIKSEGDPSMYRADLAHDKNVKEFMSKSGNFAITTNEYQAFHGLMEGLVDLGFDATPVLKVYDSYARLTPDRGGGSRRDMLQLLAQKLTMLVPGVGSFGMAGDEEQKPGIGQRVAGFFRKDSGGRNS